MALQSLTGIIRGAGVFCLAGSLLAQFNTPPGAQFGKSVPLAGQPSDIVLDEARNMLYVVNSGANRVFLYNYATGQEVGFIEVGQFPSSAAMSMDGNTLFVTNVQSASLTVIDLQGPRVVQNVSLPARPEGVEVGFDGRALVTTQGTGQNNSLNTLLIYDPNQEVGLQLIPVSSPPPISTPNPLPAVFLGRPQTAFPGRLIRTPDGQFIIGMVAINQTANNAQTTLFVYEVASGTVLRNRTVTGQSTVLSMSPDGSRVMAGSTLYDVTTLNVIAQMNTANYPFILTQQGFNPVINLPNNFGGTAFSPDGQTVYGAFNIAQGAPNARPLSDVMLLANSRNLGVRLGIRLPESILGKIVTAQDGTRAFATSESGIVDLPLGQLFEHPIIMPDSTQVFLANDLCNRGIARATVRVNNLGSGRLTFAVPVLTTALVAQAKSGLAPSQIDFVMEPGRTGVQRQPGTNVFTGAGLGGGAPINVTLTSREAINLPNTIRVYMNFRQSDQRGVIHPVPVSLANGEGLWELVLDEPRGRVYIANSGYNRIEVFDTRRQRFIEPIEVGQLPHSMAISLDRNTLYVGNAGGESISIVDLDARRVVGQAEFPPIPRAGAQGAITPRAIGVSVSGVQFVMSNGGLWRLLGNQALPRPASPIISPNNTTTTIVAGAPNIFFAATAGGDRLALLGGDGNAYLYDGLADQYTVRRTVNQAPIQSYFGPSAAGPGASYFLLNGLILSPSLAVIGGAERPGVVQFGPPAAPGQPPTQTVVSSGQRHVASSWALDENQFVRLTVPVRANILAATRDDARPTIELVNIRTGAESVVAIAPDNPAFLVFGAQRANVPARHMVVDSQGTAYVITLSGLAVIPLQRSGAPVRPLVSAGSRGILNANNGTTAFGPGAFITITGTNLATPATADTAPLPYVLGGSCVTLSDLQIPLLQSAPGQITAQIPDDLRPGVYVAQVRSLATATQSDAIQITVQRPQ
ncbi:MAG: hypothetical protein FJW39_05670 [Acidobacteria bacterium]|nr:hypothetical protein [Acidobacteriota bacterium]